MNTQPLWSITLLLSLFSVFSIPAQAEKKAPKVTVAEAQAWDQGIQKPLYCRGDVPHRLRVASHVFAELDEVLPLASTAKKGEIIAKQNDFYLQQQLAGLHADIATQEAEYHYSLKEFTRLKALEDQSLASKSDLGRFERDYKTAAARISALREQVKTVKHQIANLVHYAPTDGTILQLFVEPGEWIRQGEGILVFLPEHHQEITCRVSLEIFNTFNQFNGVSYHLITDETQPTATVPLTLLRKASFVERDDQTFTAHFGFADKHPDNVFLGQRFTVVLRQTADDLVQVPYDALTLAQNQTFVWQLDAQNKAHKLPVDVVDTHSNYAVIRSTIGAQQQVVVKGKQALTENIAVEVARNISQLAENTSAGNKE